MRSRPFTSARRRPRRRWPALLLSFLLLLVASFFLFTSTAPIVPARPAPTAAEVGAGRDAYRQLRGAKGRPDGAPISLGQAQLSGLAAVASHGLRPDRLSLVASGSALRIQGSHSLPLGRWLNVTADVAGPSPAFPPVRLTVGAVAFPPWLSRPLIEVTRWLYVQLRGADVPPVDRIARDFAVTDGRLTARISLGRKSGVVDQMAGIVSRPIDRDAVIRIYCALAEQQKQQPSTDLAEQVHRAFSLDESHTAASNGAAFVALGILLVDDRVADFARLAPADFHGCAIPPIRSAIYGRTDSPKHWALSAAIAVGAGTQLSEAVGEWKELADSLARQSQFAIGDPTGFSLADLSADRAGFEAARAATQPDSAARVGNALASATAEQLLPHALLEREDGLSNAEFVKRYGGIDDPRFKARVAEIDAAIAISGMR